MTDVNAQPPLRPQETDAQVFGAQVREQLDAVMPAVLDAVARAGIAIMAVYERGWTQAQNKSDGSPVTQADLASHHVMVDALAQLTPQWPVVSEEGALPQALPAGPYWLLDPLDGTKEFLARNGEFAVCLALVVDYTPVWGVLFGPAAHQWYWGGALWGAQSYTGAGVPGQTIYGDQGLADQRDSRLAHATGSTAIGCRSVPEAQVVLLSRRHGTAAQS